MSVAQATPGLKSEEGLQPESCYSQDLDPESVVYSLDSEKVVELYLQCHTLPDGAFPQCGCAAPEGRGDSAWRWSQVAAQ